MPRRTTATPPGEAKDLKNHSFEMLVATWLMQDGWQVFVPLLDHGHCTDLLISDGPKYYRLQIKTIEAQSEAYKLQNRWSHSNIDYVMVFAKNSNWGYIPPAFKERQKRLDAKEHQKFQHSRAAFLKAFHSVA